MRLFFCVALILNVLNSFCQTPIYSFWKDDSLLRKNYYDQTIKKRDLIISGLGKEHKKDYKEIYEYRFEHISYIWKTGMPITAPEPHRYLQSIVQKIVDANPELKPFDLRVAFARNMVPNAFSMGDGTILINAGLMVFLENEAQLVSILCHELAHYYLDHSGDDVKKIVATWNDEELKKEAKAIIKQKYRVMEQLGNLKRKLLYSSFKHSREQEAAADRQGFIFFKRTGYDPNAVISSLQTLDKLQDTSLYEDFKPQKHFNFEQYPFKNKWIQKSSAIFGQMSNDDSPLTQAEKDSLKTHPDVPKRIELLIDSVKNAPPGKKFLVNENLFHELKKKFVPEVMEYYFKLDAIHLNLHIAFQLLDANENRPLAIYSIARDLNLLYERQKDHKLQDIDKETRGYPNDYNLLLRIIDRWKLDEIASIAFYFCKKYESEMSKYPAFSEELKKAEKVFDQYKN